MNIQQIIKNSRLSPLDAELLLSLALDKPREFLFSHPERELSFAQIAKFNKLAKRRLNGEPIAYISGKKEFYGLDFFVNKNVLIPRPETELLVEKALNRTLSPKCNAPDTIIDVGTGSGNIIISVAKNIPIYKRKRKTFYATDISDKALNIAKKNASKHRIRRHIKFLKSDLLEFVFDSQNSMGNILLIANLPYVSKKIYKKNKVALKYEPKTALISRENGLHHYSNLFKQIKKISASSIFGAVYLLEISPEQRNGAKIFAKRYFPGSKIKFHKDLSGKDRVFEMIIK